MSLATGHHLLESLRPHCLKEQKHDGRLGFGETVAARWKPGCMAKDDTEIGHDIPLEPSKHARDKASVFLNHRVNAANG